MSPNQQQLADLLLTSLEQKGHATSHQLFCSYIDFDDPRMPFIVDGVKSMHQVGQALGALAKRGLILRKGSRYDEVLDYHAVFWCWRPL